MEICDGQEEKRTHHHSNDDYEANIYLASW